MHLSTIHSLTCYILVVAPDASSLSMIPSLTKVPWLQFSKRAYVVTSSLLFTYLILTGTIQILVILSLHDALQLTSLNLAQLLLDVGFFLVSSDAPKL